MKLKFDSKFYLKDNNNMKKILILIILLFFLEKGYSYWEWTSQTKKWINPKHAVRPTPEEQFNYAEELRKNGNVDIAIREHIKLLKYYPKSEYAPKSCFILGGIYKEMGEDKKAFDYFQKIISDYPSSSLVCSAIKIQSEIAERYLETKKTGVLKIFTKKEEKGELMSKVIENSPYDIEAPKRMFKLANFYYEIKEYEKSMEVLNKIIKNFPENKEIQEEAKYLKIKYILNSISENNFDTDIIENLRDKIFEFQIEFPESKYKEDIEKVEKILKEKEAQIYYQIAKYYERAGKKKGANYYYIKIIEKVPESSYGKIANEKINK
jgi:outer membrane protein assembly factor BamD (BamD/ComL family)